jgi:hypothetical protein
MMQQPTRWPIHQTGKVYSLTDSKRGKRLSWHRTLTGALRARRVLIMARDGIEEDFNG